MSYIRLILSVKQMARDSLNVGWISFFKSTQNIPSNTFFHSVKACGTHRANIVADWQRNRQE